MQTIPKDFRDAARAYVETHTADDAPRYYRFRCRLEPAPPYHHDAAAAETARSRGPGRARLANTP